MKHSIFIRVLIFMAAACFTMMLACECGDENDSDDAGDNDQEDIETATLDGHVFDLDRKPVGGVSVFLNGAFKAESADDGTFSFGVDASGESVLVFNKKGYVTQSFAVAPPPGGDRLIVAFLKQRSAPQTLDAGQGGNVTVDGSSVFFPPSAFSDNAGNPVSGYVDVYFTPFDPTTSDLDAFPGGFMGVDENDEEVMLRTYGWAEIVVVQNDKELDLATGQKADFTLKISDSIAPDAGQTIPLWYLDETQGKWVQEGHGTVVADNGQFIYRAAVPHLSSWNVDNVIPNDEMTCIQGWAVDTHLTPYPGIWIYATDGGNVTNGLWRGWALADDKGHFCLNVPRNTALSLFIYYQGWGNVGDVLVGRDMIDLVSPSNNNIRCPDGNCMMIGMVEFINDVKMPMRYILYSNGKMIEYPISGQPPVLHDLQIEAFKKAKGECSFTGGCRAGATEAWVVGADFAAQEGVLMHFENGDWTREKPAAASDLPLGVTQVVFPEPDRGWVAAYQYLLEYDAGQWSKLDVTSVPGSQVFLVEGLCFSSADSGWVFGGKTGFLRYVQGDWSSIDTPELAGVNYTLSACQAPGEDEAWFFGVNDNSFQAEAIHYSGGSFEEVPLPLSYGAWILDAAFLDAQHGWACGLNVTDSLPLLLRIENGLWADVSADLPSEPGLQLDTLFFSDFNMGAAAGSQPGAESQPVILWDNGETSVYYPAYDTEYIVDLF